MRFADRVMEIGYTYREETYGIIGSRRFVRFAINYAHNIFGYEPEDEPNDTDMGSIYAHCVVFRRVEDIPVHNPDNPFSRPTRGEEIPRFIDIHRNIFVD